MIDKTLISELCDQHDFYKSLEIEAKSKVVVSKDQYLCVRLDGIGFSKRYFKDKINNPGAENAIHWALNSTYKNTLRHSFWEDRNIYLGAFVSSDEVSIIFDKNLSSYNSDLFKICTLLAAKMSSFFTGDLRHSYKGGFDARPLIFSSIADIKKYLSYRFATYIRNTSVKELRLAGVDTEELYQNENNIDYIWEKITGLDKEKDRNCYQKHPRLFIPDPKNKLIEYKFSSLQEFMESELLNPADILESFI